MNPDSTQFIVRQVYARQIASEAMRALDSQHPFALYDALTPNEPRAAWQLAMRLLKVLANCLTSRGFQISTALSRQAVHSVPSDLT